MTKRMIEPPEQTRTRLQHLLDGALATWQGRLRLADWTLTGTVGKVGKVRGNPTCAGTTVNPSFKHARLRLPLDFVQRVRRMAGLRHYTEAEHVEQTVIHELLHVVEFPLFGAVMTELNRLEDKAELPANALRRALDEYREWWINHLTYVLVDADRGTWAPPEPPEQPANVTALPAKRSPRAAGDLVQVFDDAQERQNVAKATRAGALGA